ncbi:MAG: peptidoglycan-associated lipoprotein Pal [Gammaproteobacteria bacterium]|nr:peptidoglycan-associated lipoprotein Pal [Gammaproteobacteria bacterium]
MKFTYCRTGLLLIALLVFMSGCALLPCNVPESPPEIVEEEPTEVAPVTIVEPPPPPPPPEPTTPAGYREGTDTQGRAILVAEYPDGGTVAHTFNFNFDESDLASGDFSALNRHAELLARDRSLTITIEGHCDERGTREYNMALGERRAQAVADYLMGAGVRASQITTVSFGEERPVDGASNEAAWAKNRRAEIIMRP